MSQKYDVYKDGEGDWVITPADSGGLVAPTAIACVSGSAADSLDGVLEIINEDKDEFLRRLRICSSQSVIDHFGPYAFMRSIEV